MDVEIQKLIDASNKAREFAYCPYSRFPVGAALLCEDDKIITGCNVENASYGLSICAERTAITKAVSCGNRKFKAIAVSTTLLNDYAAPCGACRQFLAEFGTDYDVYLIKGDGNFKKMTVAELLPYAFTPEFLTFERDDKIFKNHNAK